ncbi:hypothetical protein EHR03_13050 [Leptospira mayottensis]|uniref:Uncharacterized protein n=1 Tax=Leptospira mayottensis 200901116 TaxID=1192864 RepID=M6VBU5_9LEPT|nr:hypothetical protein [Leptospira mayottensis]AVH81583.1 hypothetical protein [Leptospira mayottensis 200901116]TGN00351.1 hypothetical protein EHR03_13050 [Leptospira mayottensis]
MKIIKLTLARLVLNYITICLNWRFALGLDPNYGLAFMICLVSEITYTLALNTILKEKEKL